MLAVMLFAMLIAGLNYNSNLGLAFAFLVGIVTGTYSSVYVASPVVLWLSGVSAAPIKDVPPENVRGMQPAR